MSAWKVGEIFSKNPIKVTALSGFVVQFTRPLISLITLPLLISNLGQSGLGVWMIALSIMGLVTTLNSGLSISLVTWIGRASADHSESGVQPIISAATMIAVLTSIFVVATTLPAIFLVDWVVLFDISGTPSGDDVRSMMVVLAILASIGIVTSVPRQVMLGRMHGYVAHMFEIVGVLGGAGALICALLFDAPLWLLALAFMGPSSLVMVIGGVTYLHYFNMRFFVFRTLSRHTLLHLWRDSFRMLGYHGAYSISSQSDFFLIGIILGAPASAAYGVAQRVFSLPNMLALSINTAQWPAFARANSRGETAAAARMFRTTLLIVPGVATIIAVAMALFYQEFLELWLGHGIETSLALLLGMVVWVPIATIANTFDSFLRARNETSLLMRAMIAMACINIAVTLILLLSIGAAGAIWGTIAGYTLAVLLPYASRLRVIFRTPVQVIAQGSGTGASDAA